MRGVDEILARVLSGGDDPARRAVFDAHFALGAPRKLRRAAERFDLARLRVLDVGCGHGTYLVHFADGSVGIDRSEERVAFARSLGLAAHARDVEQPAWSGGLPAFDLVWLCDILPHLDDPEAFLRSLPPVLAPGARIVITDWLWPESPRLARLLARVLPGGREVLEAQDHRRAWSRRSLSAALARAGFEIESSECHTFRSPLARALSGRIWPPRTLVARPAPRRIR